MSDSPSPSAVPGAVSRRITLPDLWRFFRERWLLGLLFGAVAAAAVISFEPGGPSVYRAEVYLQCSPRRDPTGAGVFQSRPLNPTEITTHVEQLRSKAFLDYVLASFSADETRRIQAAYADGTRPGESAPSLAEVLWPNVSFFSRKSTPIIGIAVNHPDPELAVLIANRYARRYIEYNIDRAVTGSNSALIFLRRQTDDLRRQVVAAETALQDYRARHNLASLGETQGVIVQKLSSLGASLVNAQMEQVQLKGVLDNIAHFERNDRPLTEIPAVLAYGQVAASKASLENLRAQRALMSERYLRRHPRMIENELTAAEVRRQLEEELARAAADFRARHEIAMRSEQQLREELQATEARARELDKISIDYRLLEQDALTKRTAYARLSDRLNDAEIGAQLENTNIQIFDEARGAAPPVDPRLNPTFLLAAGAGLCGLVCVPLLVGLLDSRVKTTGQVETLLGQKLLGVVRRTGKSSAEIAQAFLRDKAGPATESYRGLYSEIEIASALAYPKSLLITSSAPGEGKSLLAGNLAAVFASHGRRTLLVDCDLRRPSLHHYFQIKAQSGWTQWLQQAPQERPPLSQIVVSLAPRFDLLPSGRPPENCTQLLEQLAHAGLQKQLLADYDLVIFDTPPVAVFPDAALLARSCHELIFACQFGNVALGTAQRALARLVSTGVKVLGIVLTQAPEKWSEGGFFGYGTQSAKYYRTYGQRSRA